MLVDSLQMDALNIENHFDTTFSLRTLLKNNHILNKFFEPVTWPLYVVYFYLLLGAACTQKLVETFFPPFSTFFAHFKAFSVISLLKSTENVWKWTKKCGFVCFSKLVNMQKLVNSLRGYPEIVFFGWFFTFFNITRRVDTNKLTIYPNR